jgi:hypothetical protein
VREPREAGPLDEAHPPLERGAEGGGRVPCFGQALDDQAQEGGALALDDRRTPGSEPMPPAMSVREEFEAAHRSASSPNSPGSLA